MTTTVILGSGIIGLATAYYLSEHQPGSSIHLVDSSTELFASASGYAGGFVAKDWFQSSVASLGELSFDEHEKLADQEGGREKWGYSKSVTINYDPRGEQPFGKSSRDWLIEGASRSELVRDRQKEGREENIPRWLRRVEGDHVSVVDADGGTAIVDPLKLCHFLLEKCKEAGVQIHHPAKALSITTDVRGELASVCIGYTDSSAETELPATRLLLSSGAWTPEVFETLFPNTPIKIPVMALAGHSLVVKVPDEFREDSCHAVYASLGALSPELYSRTNGVIYMAGVNDTSMPLPTLASGSTAVEASLDKLKQIAKSLISTAEGQELEVVRSGLCFRPVTDRGVPILSRLSDDELGEGVNTRPGADGGVFLAVGHGPWGISLSLGTGKVMAEMMQGRRLSANVSRLGLQGAYSIYNNF